MTGTTDSYDWKLAHGLQEWGSGPADTACKLLIKKELKIISPICHRVEDIGNPGWSTCGQVEQREGHRAIVDPRGNKPRFSFALATGRGSTPGNDNRDKIVNRLATEEITSK